MLYHDNRCGEVFINRDSRNKRMVELGLWRLVRVTGEEHRVGSSYLCRYWDRPYKVITKFDGEVSVVWLDTHEVGVHRTPLYKGDYEIIGPTKEGDKLIEKLNSGCLVC